MAFTRSRGLFESTRVLFLPIHDIAPNPGQPRTRFSHESLEELADSIRAHGILQPLSVRRLSTSQYELISGERRLRAAEMAGLSHVPAFWSRPATWNPPCWHWWKIFSGGIWIS